MSLYTVWVIPSPLVSASPGSRTLARHMGDFADLDEARGVACDLHVTSGRPVEIDCNGHTVEVIR